MIDLIPLSPPVQAALLVGVVFVEAILLYVGYGMIEQATAPYVIDRIKNA